jgi:hypothetical protein
MAGGEGARDDRILPATRWAALAVFCVLVAAWVVLFLFPGETPDAWAWTIEPDLTPVFMGAGYGAGAYFFFRTFRAERWHPSSVGFLSAAVFAALMLVATLIHWDKFNHGDAPFLAALAFYGWVAIYIASPFVVFALWRANERTDPREPAPGEPLVPGWVLRLARVFGVGAAFAAALFFVSPETAMDVWPWELTPLTARVLACFTAEVGVAALLLSNDARWGSWRLLVETFILATVLLIVGAGFHFGDFDAADVTTWLYLGGLAGSGLALLALYGSMRARELGAD